MEVVEELLVVHHKLTTILQQQTLCFFEHFLQSTITTVGTVTTGNVQPILPSGTMSGSSQIGSGDITVTQLETPSFTFNGSTIQLGDSVSTVHLLRWN